MEVLLEHPAVEGGERESAVAAAVPVIDEGERRGGEGAGLLFLELALLVLLTDLGGDDVEHPLAEDAQRACVVLARVLEQGVTSLSADGQVDEVGREVVDGAGDDVGLVDAQPAVGESIGDRLVQLGVEALGEATHSSGLAAGDPAPVRPPCACRPCADRVTHAPPIGFAERAAEGRGEPGLRLSERVDRLDHLALSQRGQPQVADVIERGTQRGQRLAHRTLHGSLSCSLCDPRDKSLQARRHVEGEQLRLWKVLHECDPVSSWWLLRPTTNRPEWASPRVAANRPGGRQLRDSRRKPPIDTGGWGEIGRRAVNPQSRSSEKRRQRRDATGWVPSGGS